MRRERDEESEGKSILLRQLRDLFNFPARESIAFACVVIMLGP